MVCFPPQTRLSAAEKSPRGTHATVTLTSDVIIVSAGDGCPVGHAVCPGGPSSVWPPDTIPPGSGFRSVWSLELRRCLDSSGGEMSPGPGAPCSIRSFRVGQWCPCPCPTGPSPAAAQLSQKLQLISMGWTPEITSCLWRSSWFKPRSGHFAAFGEHPHTQTEGLDTELGLDRKFVCCAFWISVHTCAHVLKT